jgi:hypothetical protein
LIILKRVVLVLLIPVVFPVAVVFMVLLLIPIACWNSAVYAVLWLRWKCFGVPIPPISLDGGDVAPK